MAPVSKPARVVGQLAGVVIGGLTAFVLLTGLGGVLGYVLGIAWRVFFWVTG